MRATSIEVQGRTFPSVKAAALHYRQHPSRVHARLREGWIIEQALKIEPRRRKSPGGREVRWRGKRYRSLRDLAAAVGVDVYLLVSRLGRGKSLADAISGKRTVHEVGARAKPIKFRGRTYKARELLAEKYGTTWATVCKRRLRGWTLEQALGINGPPPRFRDAKGNPRRTHWVKSERVAGKDYPLASDGEYKLYVIVNRVNGKEYVGITTGRLDDRLRQHFSTAAKGFHSKFCHAVRKYGEKTFRIRLIRKDARNFADLEDQEIREIVSRDTIRQGYNSATGGGLSTSKCIEIRGKLFASRRAAAAHFGVDPAVFNIRLGRLGWTPEQAAGLVRPKYGRHRITVGGKTFGSLRQAAAGLGVSRLLAYSRLDHGWSLEAALGLVDPPPTVRYSGVAIRVGKNTFPSYAACAKHFGIKAESLRKMIVSDGIDSAVAVRYLRAYQSGKVKKRYKGRCHPLK